LIAYAKANPGKLNMGSSGIGTAGHLAGELFKMMTGVAMVNVPYTGAAPALADLMAGLMQVQFTDVTSAIGFIHDRRLRALAVTTATASPVLPGIPPLASVVPGYEVSAWFALSAPKATPAATITTLNKAINATLAEPAIVARMAELGGTPDGAQPRRIGCVCCGRNQKMGRGRQVFRRASGLKQNGFGPNRLRNKIISL
jgi:tripartite-type tricarboxylate transporter receptor subunit TctC